MKNKEGFWGKMEDEKYRFSFFKKLGVIFFVGAIIITQYAFIETFFSSIFSGVIDIIPKPIIEDKNPESGIVGTNEIMNEIILDIVPLIFFVIIVTFILFPAIFLTSTGSSRKMLLGIIFYGFIYIMIGIIMILMVSSPMNLR